MRTHRALIGIAGGAACRGVMNRIYIACHGACLRSRSRPLYTFST